MKKLQHLHILIKAHLRNPKALGLKQLEIWTEATIRAQGLIPVIGPNAVMVSDHGNEGPTGGCNLKTSHFAWHIWDETGIMQADLYTCGPLDVKKMIRAFDVFNPSALEYTVIDREHTVNLSKAYVESGIVDYTTMDMDYKSSK